MNGGLSQRARVMAQVFSPLHQAREDISTAAWIAVQRITPEVAAQEPQAIAEMIQHLQGLKEARNERLATD